MDTTPYVAVIDDDQPFPALVRLVLEAADFGPVVVVHFARPRDMLDHELLGSFTHAFVDLQLGGPDYTAADNRIEVENGVDAIAILHDRNPGCLIAVDTISVTPQMEEQVRAVRQLWPETRLIHKGDGGVEARINQFVQTGTVTDNVDLKLLAAGIKPARGEDIVTCLEATTFHLQAVRILRQLADCPTTPTMAELSGLTGHTYNVVRVRVPETCDALVDSDLMEQGRRSIGELHLWAWARRAILKRCLKEVDPPG